jgi:hypothetical protein
MVNFFFHFFSLLVEKVKEVVFEIYDLSVSFHFFVPTKLTNNGTSQNKSLFFFYCLSLVVGSAKITYIDLQIGELASAAADWNFNL